VTDTTPRARTRTPYALLSPAAKNLLLARIVAAGIVFFVLSAGLLENLGVLTTGIHWVVGVLISLPAYVAVTIAYRQAEKRS